MTKKLSILCLLAALFGFSSCDKEEEECYAIKTVDATLQWTGDYAVDGCGYFLFIGEEKYKPTNEDKIPDTYKEAAREGIAVEAEIFDNGKKIMAGCQVPQEVNAIKIWEIRNKQ